jgi:hypothetical protein
MSRRRMSLHVPDQRRVELDDLRLKRGAWRVPHRD